jgi:putative tricarboxylic transport membrane protein
MDDRRWTIDDERWRPAALIALGMALDLALMEQAGFVLASTALFWLTARAFDRQHAGRDALFALGVSAGAYLLFVRVLNVTLPAGFIAGWF